MGRGTVSSGGDRMTGPRHGSLQPHRPGNVGPGAEGHRACPREDRTRARARLRASQLVSDTGLSTRKSSLCGGEPGVQRES